MSIDYHFCAMSQLASGSIAHADGCISQNEPFKAWDLPAIREAIAKRFSIPVPPEKVIILSLTRL